MINTLSPNDAKITMQALHFNHQYAFDTSGNWVNAVKTEYKEHQVFSCECPQRHKMKLVKPSGLTGKRTFTDYFAHITPIIPHKKRKLASDHTCGSGGESHIHRMAKHKLRECVGKYFFATFHCQDCHCEDLQYTKGCSVSMEIVSDDKKWRYDCLLKQGDIPLVAMEVVYKHKTGMDKVRSVRESGLEIVEFSASEVMEIPDNDTGHWSPVTKLENIKVKIGKCQRCVSMLTFDKLNMTEKIIYYSIMAERSELISQEYTIHEGYNREFSLNQALRIEDVHEKCKALIEVSLYNLKIHLPQINENVQFNHIDKKINHGLLVSCFHNDMPTKNICIFLLSERDIENIHNIIWKHPDVERTFHVFLHCSTILKKLSTLEESCIILKDCRWAILKNLEDSRGFCANCGRKGHTSSECRTRFCCKCGRYGHLLGDCFARKDVLDQRLM